MMNNSLLLAGFITTVCLGAADAVAHPSHVSIAEAEWNRQTRKLEVALRVHTSDLESALRRHTGHRIVLETTPDVDQFIAAYVSEKFLVALEDDKPLKLIWVGEEIGVQHTWLYFEVHVPAAIQRAKFSNQVFFELLKDQVNTINFRIGASRSSLSFTRDKRVARIRTDAAVD